MYAIGTRNRKYAQSPLNPLRRYAIRVPTRVLCIYNGTDGFIIIITFFFIPQNANYGAARLRVHHRERVLTRHRCARVYYIINEHRDFFPLFSL